MGRILAIDYGRKRCGVAVTDILKIAANGLPTVATKDILKFIKDYCAKEDVEEIAGKAVYIEEGEEQEMTLEEDGFAALVGWTLLTPSTITKCPFTHFWNSAS
mgnify:CR=1 FL=1